MEVSMKPLITFSAALALSAGSAFAHHGWGSYNAAKPVTVTATIDDIVIENPHGMMMLTADGKVWHVTLAPISRMNARGATAEIVQKGKTVTAHGYPKRDGTPEFRAEWIEIDGQRFQLR
jgi:hypothetical protein